MPFIEFQNVSKIYQVGEIEIKAADNISFPIEKGEFVIIVGPSGAGKTTVLNMLGGMDKPTSGVINVDGTDIAQFNEKELTAFRRDEVGFVFQFYNLVPNLTAYENVELATQICKNPVDAEEILSEVGLANRKENFQVVNSKEFLSLVRWQKIQSSFFVTSRQVLLTT